MDEQVTEQNIVAASDVSLAVGLTTAEIDQQISTAHKFPRSVQRAMGNILSMATLDEDTSEECIYSLPRDGKTIEGPSSRFAEMVMQQWGNCRVAARVVREERDYIVAQAVYHDLETNSAISTEVQRRITGRGGRRYSADMIVTTGNAACSIARRNIILAGVPRAVWRKSYEAARQVVMGNTETLANRRANALKSFVRYGVQAPQIFTVLNVAGEEEITLDHLVTLRGMLAALKNGEATAEEMFAQTLPKAKTEGNPLLDEKPAGDTGQAGATPANQPGDAAAAEAKLNADTTPDPAKRGITNDDGVSPASDSQSEQGPIPAADFGAFHRALQRATKQQSLATFKSGFMENQPWTAHEAHRSTLQAIYEAHQKRVNLKYTAEEFLAEIKRLGAS